MSLSDRQAIRVALLDWYDLQGRKLPWRSSTDPYPVLVSEFMLQQTTVQAVLPYYDRWMARFPTEVALATASEDEALSYWAGLGYYSRCRRLHRAVRHFVAERWPASHDEWLKVPGVGLYTAAAVASITLGEPTGAVDGNVARVYSRLCADSSTGSTLLAKARVWSNTFLDPSRPGDWNQAVMELGAVICRPKNPSCLVCPTNRFCKAHGLGKATTFPAVKPDAPPVPLHHSIWVPYHDRQFGLVQTPEGEWWAGLWGFPRSEATDAPPEWAAAKPETLGRFAHTVTRYRVTVDVHLVSCEARQKGLKWVQVEDLDGYAMPSPQVRALKMANRRIAILERDPSLVDRVGEERVRNGEGD